MGFKNFFFFIFFLLNFNFSIAQENLMNFEFNISNKNTKINNIQSNIKLDNFKTEIPVDIINQTTLFEQKYKFLYLINEKLNLNSEKFNLILNSYLSENDKLIKIDLEKNSIDYNTTLYKEKYQLLKKLKLENIINDNEFNIINKYIPETDKIIKFDINSQTDISNINEQKNIINNLSNINTFDFDKYFNIYKKTISLLLLTFIFFLKFRKLLILTVLSSFIITIFPNLIIQEVNNYFTISLLFSILFLISSTYLLFEYRNSTNFLFQFQYKSLIFILLFFYLSIKHNSYIYGTITSIYINFLFYKLILNTKLFNQNYSQNIRALLMSQLIMFIIYLIIFNSNYFIFKEINYFIFGFQYYIPINMSILMIILSSPIYHLIYSKSYINISILNSILFILLSLLIIYITKYYNLFIIYNIIHISIVFIIFSFVSYIAYTLGYLLGVIIIGIYFYIVFKLILYYNFI